MVTVNVQTKHIPQLISRKLKGKKMISRTKPATTKVTSCATMVMTAARSDP